MRAPALEPLRATGAPEVHVRSGLKIAFRPVFELSAEGAGADLRSPAPAPDDRWRRPAETGQAAGGPPQDLASRPTSGMDLQATIERVRGPTRPLGGTPPDADDYPESSPHEGALAPDGTV